MSPRKRKGNCCVIGAGVTGLSTAIELLSRGYRVSVLAAARGNEITSSAAAAFWYPFWVGDEPDHSWYRPTWAWHSFLALEQFLSEPSSGITRSRLIEYFDSILDSEKMQETIEAMWWRVLPSLDFKNLPAGEVERVTCGRRRFQAAISFQTLVVNMRFYLPFLEAKFESLGGEFRDRIQVQQSDLHNLCQNFDAVVNCAGLGSRELASDLNLKPIEGIVVRVKPLAGVNDILLAHTGKVFGSRPLYVVPRGGAEPDVILGGTLNEIEGQARSREWSQLRDEPWRVRTRAEAIVEYCTHIERKLAKAEPVGYSVGYRPFRDPEVRVEPEFGRAEFAGKLFHNYGHGGGGVTLSWGCAREIGQWVSWFL